MTNGAAIGYAILAMKELGYDDEQIKLVEKTMYYKMDMVDEDYAQKIYNEF